MVDERKYAIISVIQEIWLEFLELTRIYSSMFTFYLLQLIKRVNKNAVSEMRQI